MLAQGFVRNQGDGWGWTLDWLARAVDEAALTADAPEDAFAGYLSFAAALGTRLGELHAALAQPTDNPAFAPELATRGRPRRLGRRRAGAARAGAGAARRRRRRCRRTRCRWRDAPAGQGRCAARGDLPPGAIRRRRVEDPGAWRFPSRPGAGGAGRCGDHRLRGRAGPRRWRNAAPRAARCATSPACCAASTMRRCGDGDRSLGRLATPRRPSGRAALIAPLAARRERAFLEAYRAVETAAAQPLGAARAPRRRCSTSS